MSEEQSQETQQLTREEWIQRIREETKGEVIKKEMIRLGFWSEEPLPPEEKEQQEQEDREFARLQKELQALQQESEKLEDTDTLIREARKKRIEESKRKRAERKAEREQRLAEAKKRWEEYQANHVVHAGIGVSAGLQNHTMNGYQLEQLGLPILTSPAIMAAEMGIELSRLKWLTYHRDTAALSHYHRFTIPKKSGGRRIISAPKPELRHAQEWVKTYIVDRVPVHEAAYGFIPKRSTVDNAQHHLQRAAVIKMDLKDFFPSITFQRVKGLFQSFGYSEAVSTLLALLTTEPPREKVSFDGKFYYVAVGKRQLPQGACTSPGITNLICRRLDARLTELAEKMGFTYTRYADDLTFSCDQDGLEQLGVLLRGVRDIVRFEGLQVNEKKTRVLRASRRQRVTGIVVNDKPSLPRQELRTFRALLHNVEKNGLEAENRENRPHFWEYIQGYVSYVRMVRPDLGEQFGEQLQRIAAKYGLKLNAAREREAK
ncbi:reverse transcriptase family protein [Desmospora activa]|uniref:RNA-directed DNA polymerase n=1 Tax=Desmospora activa DSM 45169 TaxID=1121389 RepID=A0A2T4Z960_9BACL|nr:reverse transcriptase family protein [Desmospora activa]PTM58419.1 RNA-directed DNA polymerase [Desmospora activa DSM 45169]